jgi:hypothetical protein
VQGQPKLDRSNAESKLDPTLKLEPRTKAPSLLPPQQTILVDPLVAAQLWAVPTASSVAFKPPATAVGIMTVTTELSPAPAWPASLEPQQTTAPSALSITQLWSWPAPR